MNFKQNLIHLFKPTFFITLWIFFLQDKIHAGDVLDELYGEALRGNKMSTVSLEQNFPLLVDKILV